MATAPKISNLPAAPNRQQPASFTPKSDALLSALPGFVSETNAVADYVEAAAGQVAIDQAAVDANVPLLNDAKAAAPLALQYRDTAKGYKDSAAASEAQTLQHLQDMQSAVVYQDLASIALSKNITMVDGCIDTSPNPPLSVQRRTSWYNETLGTTTRGTRREMPARKVWMLDATKLYLFDGDDPDLPLWGFWQATGTEPVFGQGWFFSGSTPTSLQAKSGIAYFGIPAGHSARKGLLYVDLPNDAVGRISDAGVYGGHGLNAATGVKTEALPVRNTRLLVDGSVHSISEVLAPDAPLDPVSGLPVPTVAVGTDLGVSFLENDGTVLHWTARTQCIELHWLDEDRLFIGRCATTNYRAAVIKRVGQVVTIQAEYGVNTGTYPVPFKSNAFTSVNAVFGDAVAVQGFPQHGTRLLSLLTLDEGSYAEGLLANISTKHNSGWMVGDTKGAWLSSIDTTALVGSGELIANGAFDSDVTGWSSATSTGTGSISWVDGKLRLNSDTVSNRARAAQSFPTVVGNTYVLSYSAVGAHHCYVGTSEAGSQTAAFTNQTTGNLNFTFTASGSTTWITFEGFVGAGGEPTIDNVSVKLADPNRSPQFKGLVVNGTLTRTPVATGAELVGYSGFSATKYLTQPYNSDLDFGTGDFHISLWVRDVKGQSTSFLLGRRNAGDTYDDFSVWRLTSSGSREIRFSVGPVTISSGTSLDEGVWSLVSLVRKGGVISLYVNGDLRSSDTSTHDISGQKPLSVGARINGGDSAGSIALSLLRIGATAPTAEQIAKSYRDELLMFQPNSKVTLHGTSDAVTALAYDETTGLIHAGTSAGRSDFAGLIRVGQTDTSVTTKIVAHDGMILEQ